MPSYLIVYKEREHHMICIIPIREYDIFIFQAN